MPGQWNKFSVAMRCGWRRGHRTHQVHVLALVLGECFMQVVRFQLSSAGTQGSFPWSWAPSKVLHPEDVQFKFTELWFLAREAKYISKWVGISSCASM
jgi:hypothetical protein